MHRFCKLCENFIGNLEIVSNLENKKTDHYPELSEKFEHAGFHYRQLQLVQHCEIEIENVFIQCFGENKTPPGAANYGPMDNIDNQKIIKPSSR